MIKSKSRNALEALVQLHDMKKYSRVVMVVGSDRVADFNTLLNRYNGEDVKHGFYQFDEIKVVSAGERDPDAEGVEGMSASKMRAPQLQMETTMSSRWEFLQVYLTKIARNSTMQLQRVWV